MKRLLIIATVIASVFVGSVWADETKETTKWQVNITIQYNAVDRGEAEKIAKRIMKQNEKACTAEVKIKKVDGQYITFSNGGDSIILTPGVALTPN